MSLWCIGQTYASELKCVPSPSVAERRLLKSPKYSVVQFQPLMDTRDDDLGPLCMQPVTIPVDARSEALAQGCLLKDPSVSLGRGQLALWLCSPRKAGDQISTAGYWGDVCFRKPAHNTVTV